jgi:hypothetical protein
MVSGIDFLLPTEVSSLFNEMMQEKDKGDLTYKRYYYKIAREMKKAIRQIDTEIDNVALGKKA